MNLPKIIHQIWIGPEEIPKHCLGFSEKMRIIHPDWEYKLWTHDEIFNDRYKDDKFLQEYITNPDVYKWAFMADRVRLLLLRDFGGIYCDLDANPIRPFDTLLGMLNSGHTFFAGMKPTQDNNTLTWAHGCNVFNNEIISKMEPDVALFGYEYFYDTKIGPKTIVLHDIEDTRLFSWVDDDKLTKAW